MGAALRAGPPGGRRRLAALISRYGEAIEADLTFRGIDFGTLWRERRWRLLLNLIDHLPTATHFMEAVAMDEELARAREATAAARAGRRRTHRISEWTPEVAVGADIHDLLVLLLAATTGKDGPRLPFYPRPQTAAGQLEAARRQAMHEQTVRRLLPHA
ncbi:MAG TPA: hypothetical protein VHB02_06010 [Acidimicrobiales bacterium]|nr:hypothetical protein [Acidimicrobiales bacterium]